MVWQLHPGRGKKAIPKIYWWQKLGAVPPWNWNCITCCIAGLSKSQKNLCTLSKVIVLKVIFLFGPKDFQGWIVRWTTYRHFQKQGYPQIINFNRVFHYKPSILGYQYFWKHPYIQLVRRISEPSTVQQYWPERLCGWCMLIPWFTAVSRWWFQRCVMLLIYFYPKKLGKWSKL